MKMKSGDLGNIIANADGVAEATIVDTQVVMSLAFPLTMHEVECHVVWDATNPRGAERLPAGIVKSESGLYIYNSSALPIEESVVKPKYLLTFTVGYQLRTHIYISVRKVITVRLHVWYTKRFLHPDIVAPYYYIFIWDEDLGIDKFDPQEYIRLVKKYRLDISQPGLSLDSVSTWRMTQKKDDQQKKDPVGVPIHICHHVQRGKLLENKQSGGFDIPSLVEQDQGKDSIGDRGGCQKLETFEE
ncbi:hypothetical protein AgCh_034601 [Apium graveolens]